MIVTQYIGNMREDNYKQPKSDVIRRKNYDFKSLKELAEWSRKNYFLAFPQKESSLSRSKENCNELFLGTDLLWLDADYDVDVDDVKDRWKKANLKGFLYFTSRYYSEGIKRLRICVKVKGLTLENALAYAQEVTNILNLKEIDKSQYNSTAYYAPVRIVDKNTLQSTTPKFKKIDLWVFKGKILELDVKPEIKTAKSKRKTKNTNLEKPKSKELLSFGQFLDSLECVASTTVRDNNTINIIFKDIPEKTPNGYFINPYENAWKINHPNDKIIYASEAFKDDFEQYKQYILDNFSIHQPSSESNPDEIIQTKSPYLKPSIFDYEAELLFVEAPTGSGKSTSLSKWLKQHKDKSILFISVNRAQAIQTHRALIKEGLDFECYLPTTIDTAASCIKDNKQYYLSEFIANARKGIVPERLICGVLSLHHLIKDTNLHRTFDYVIIDEITTLPRAVIDTVSFMADHIFRFNQDMTALYYILQNAEKVICLDGFIPSCIVEAIENIAGKQKYHIRKDFRTDKRVEIYLTKDPSQPKLNGNIICKKFMNQLDYDISNRNNEILLIALSVKKKAHELYHYIRLKHKLNIELITNRLNNKKDILNFIKHLDKNLLNTDIMIYSPSITTGVDIPQAEDTNVYHLIEGKHLSSHIHYQMTMRGRNASCYKILMPTHLFNNQSSNTDKNPAREMLNILTLLYKMPKTKLNNKLFDNQLFLTVLKEYQMGMGVVLAYNYFEQLKISLDDINQKDIKNHIKSKVSVYTATQLEIANITLNNLDREESTGQQYLSLLAHEGCKVSVELDATYKTKYDREKKLKAEIKLLKLPVTEYKQTNLYSLKNKYCFIQKILHLEYGYDKSSDTTIKIHEILKKAFKIAKLNFKTTNIKIHSDILVKIYNYIFKEIMSESKIKYDKIFLDIFKNTKLSDSTKIRRVTYLLNLFFNTNRQHKNSKDLQVKMNIQLHKSIQNMTLKHKKILYINNKIDD